MVEFRLYYDDNGRVLCYTCDKLESGNFLVIDAQTYAECRFDLKIIDEKIIDVNKSTVLKLVPSSNGITCALEDNAIIVDETYTGNVINWDLKIYECIED